MNVPFEIAERIREKKARYCRAMDTKQWADLESVMLPDATLRFYDAEGEIMRAGGIRYEFASPSAFTSTMRVVFANAATSHRVSNSELELRAPGEVSAIWAMEDVLAFAPIAGFLAIRMRGYGHYHEIWQEREGDWFLARLELKRTLVTLNLVGRVLDGLSRRFQKASPNRAG